MVRMKVRDKFLPPALHQFPAEYDLGFWALGLGYTPNQSLKNHGQKFFATQTLHPHLRVAFVLQDDPRHFPGGPEDESVRAWGTGVSANKSPWWGLLGFRSWNPAHAKGAWRFLAFLGCSVASGLWPFQLLGSPADLVPGGAHDGPRIALGMFMVRESCQLEAAVEMWSGGAQVRS